MGVGPLRARIGGRDFAAGTPRICECHARLYRGAVDASGRRRL